MRWAAAAAGNDEPCVARPACRQAVFCRRPETVQEAAFSRDRPQARYRCGSTAGVGGVQQDRRPEGPAMQVVLGVDAREERASDDRRAIGDDHAGNVPPLGDETLEAV